MNTPAPTDHVCGNAQLCGTYRGTPFCIMCKCGTSLGKHALRDAVCPKRVGVFKRADEVSASTVAA